MTIVSTILGVESGGRNITQGNIGDINNRLGTPAQGYFQITDPTWAQFGGLNTGYTSAIQAPYATQLAVAQNIPIGRWGPNTQAALQAAGYSYSPNQTLGSVMNQYGEGGTQTASAGVPDNAQGATPASDTSSDPLGSSVTMNPDQSIPGATTPATAPSTTPSTSTAATGDAGTGTPETQGLQTGTINAIQGWITGIENAFGGGLKSAITAAETATGTWLGSVQNWFTRAGLIVLGIILLAVALIAMLWDHGGKETVVNMGRAAAA